MKSGPSRVNAPLEDKRERKARVLHRVLHRACALRFLLLFAPVRIRVASKRSEEAFTLHGLPVVCIVCYDLLYRMSAGDFFLLVVSVGVCCGLLCFTGAGVFYFLL